MHGNLVIVVLLVVLGCAALGFGVVYLCFRLVAGLGRGCVRLFRPGSDRSELPSDAEPGHPRMCPNLRCRKIDIRSGRFCSQCGVRI